jgi:hypothetical protein
VSTLAARDGVAIVGTLMQQAIIDYRWIALGLGVGTVWRYRSGTRVPMTAMPQRIAIALTFGASAATLGRHRGVITITGDVGVRPAIAVASRWCSVAARWRGASSRSGKRRNLAKAAPGLSAVRTR